MLLEPLRDKNFSQLLRFLFVWSLTSNLAIPFFAVYMLNVIGLPLPAVISFTVLSLGANVLFMRVWGPMADRLGSKTVLSLSASLYLLVILGWVFTLTPDRHVLTIPLLGVLHVFAGVAAAGVTLTISTLALKQAPEEKATAFLGAAGVATYLGAGAGPIAGGVLADIFASRSLRFDFTWTSPEAMVHLPALSVTGFEFLFLIAFVTGLLSLNLLVALREEGEMPRDVALRELMAGVEGSARAVSSAPGVGALSAMSYGYLKRVPGADVAIGVSAYQLAAATQAAVASVSREADVDPRCGERGRGHCGRGHRQWTGRRRPWPRACSPRNAGRCSGGRRPRRRSGQGYARRRPGYAANACPPPDVRRRGLCRGRLRRRTGCD